MESLRINAVFGRHPADQRKNHRAELIWHPGTQQQEVIGSFVDCRIEFAAVSIPAISTKGCFGARVRPAAPCLLGVQEISTRPNPDFLFLLSFSSDGNSRLQRGVMSLDDVDRKILAELTRDGRMSVTQGRTMCKSRVRMPIQGSPGWPARPSAKLTALVAPIKAAIKSAAHVTLRCGSITGWN